MITSERTYMLPLNAFIHVLFLFLLQDDLNEQLLQFLITVVDTELLKTDQQQSHITISINSTISSIIYIHSLYLLSLKVKNNAE